MGPASTATTLSSSAHSGCTVQVHLNYPFTLGFAVCAPIVLLSGMSLRSVRKHIAAIMKNLGAESRFQAGVNAATANLVRHDLP